MVRKNIMDNMETHNKNMNELKEQLSTATETEKVDIEKRIKTIETNISNMEQKKKDIEDKLSKLETELGGSQKNNVETFAGTVDNLSKTD
jgi:chromosome segregation ATPase